MTELVDAPQATKAINHWIGGKRREGGSGRTGPVYDPATGVQTGSVDFASAEEVDHAVQAARAAFPDLAGPVACPAGGALLPDPRALQRAPARISPAC